MSEPAVPDAARPRSDFAVNAAGSRTKTLSLRLPLIWQMGRRDLTTRYKGSVLGLFWSFVTPLLMLAVYTFAFSVVLHAHWTNPPVGPGSAVGVAAPAAGGLSKITNYALQAFAGLLLFNIFAECATRAPGLLVTNTNLVKKVIFPIEVLPCALVASAMIQAVISVFVLLLFVLLTRGGVPWTCVFWPMIVLPFLLYVLGFTWFLSAVGVFLRDAGQSAAIFVMVLMYLSPIFYPLHMIHIAWVRPLLWLNPLTFAAQQSRYILIDGRMPALLWFLPYTAGGALAALAGLACFQRLRGGFGDVL